MMLLYHPSCNIHKSQGMVLCTDPQLERRSSQKNSKTCQNEQKWVLEDSMAHDWLTDSFHYETGQNGKVFIICTIIMLLL